MDYVLVVKQPVYGSQGAFLAYQLAQELVQKHRICQIFFIKKESVTATLWCIPPTMNLIW